MSNTDCASHPEIGVGTLECLLEFADPGWGALKNSLLCSDSNAIVTTLPVGWKVGFCLPLLSPRAEGSHWSPFPPSPSIQWAEARAKERGGSRGSVVF